MLGMTLGMKKPFKTDVADSADLMKRARRERERERERERRVYSKLFLAHLPQLGAIQMSLSMFILAQLLVC